MLARLEASKKGVAKPYLAKILPGFKREFAEKFKMSNTRRGFQLHVEVGDIIDGRGSIWSGNGSNFIGGYFCCLITDQGAITIDREVANYIIQQRAEGWLATGMWSVEDGQHAIRIGSDEALGDTPCPGHGDCSGIVFEKDGKIRLVEDYSIHGDDYEGRKSYIAPLDGNGFLKCDLAPRLHQLAILSD